MLNVIGQTRIAAIRMKRFAIASAIGVAAAIVVFGGTIVDAVPAKAAEACVTGVARWDTLNARTGPSTRNRVIFRLPSGACGVNVTGPCEGNWCKVRFRGRSGWVNTRYLSSAGYDDGDDGIGGGYTEDLLRDGIYCPAIDPWDRLNVREGPGTRFAIVGSMRVDYCNIRGTGRCLGKWCEIATHEFTGWVNTNYLRNVESGY
ncbi:MAG: SH3 domain-containing protein [Hyphomicrobiales bacterium]|nr:SH3 domain-containing protein [Hyphomicrobiales bacterium]